ncbi:MAG: hypothetical protein U1F43_38875 [Myxococcota bacterium]
MNLFATLGARRLLLPALVLGAAAHAGCSAIVDFQECASDDGCPSGYRCASQVCVQSEVPVGSRVAVSGVIGKDTSWDADHVYEVSGMVFVDPDVTLVIAAGTRIEFKPGAGLVVDRGGHIEAVGTQLNPIVMTSARPVGQRAAGDWTGLQLLGNAPTSWGNDVSFPGLEASGRSHYGGADPESSCGTVEYLRIEFAGVSKDGDRELPAFALLGCGAGSDIDHVHVHRSLDLGVQLVGGTVSVEHILVTFAAEIGLEYTKGWTGSAQFVMIQAGVDGNVGINGEEGNLAASEQPGARGHIANFTVLADPAGSAQIGVQFQSGARAEMYDGIVAGQGHHTVNVESDDGDPLLDTAAQAEAGEISIANTVFFRPSGAGEIFPPPSEETGAGDDDNGFDEDAFFSDADSDNLFDVDPQLTYSSSATSWVPGNSTLASGAKSLVDPFEPGASYYGAFKPGVPPWTDGWTAMPAN